MKRESYGKLISATFTAMRHILFRPFNFRKWIGFGIIILIAGQFGGFSFNFSGAEDMKRLGPAMAAQGISRNSIKAVIDEKVMPAVREVLDTLRRNTPLMALSILTVILLIVTSLLWLYVKCTFMFVYIDSLLNNETAIRIPFNKHRPLGSSYFIWRLLFGALSTAVSIGIIWAGIRSVMGSGLLEGFPAIDFQAIFSAIRPHMILFAAVMLLMIAIEVLTVDFAVVIMYCGRMGIFRAWKALLGIFRKHALEILLYLLLKTGLMILAIIAVIILAIIAVLIFLLAGGIFALLAMLVKALIPPGAPPLIIAALTGIGASIMALIVILLGFIFIPIPIFFRLFPMYVLGSMEQGYDPFTGQPGQIEADKSEERYHKPIFIIWMALVVLPLVVLALFTATGVMATTAVGGIGLPNIQKVIGGGPSPFGKKPFKVTLPERPLINAVRVFLKNGRDFEAEIDGETDTTMTFRIIGGTFTLPKGDIESIERPGKPGPYPETEETVGDIETVIDTMETRGEDGNR